jgi:hypothetical protein
MCELGRAQDGQRSKREHYQMMRHLGHKKHTFALRPRASAFTFVDCIPPPRRDRARSSSAGVSGRVVSLR